jgi:hypothetical protein
MRLKTRPLEGSVKRRLSPFHYGKKGKKGTA